MPPLPPGTSLVEGVPAGAGAVGGFEQAVADIVVTGWAKKDPVEALLMEVSWLLCFVSFRGCRWIALVGLFFS